MDAGPRRAPTEAPTPGPRQDPHLGHQSPKSQDRLTPAGSLPQSWRPCSDQSSPDWPVQRRMSSLGSRPWSPIPGWPLPLPPRGSLPVICHTAGETCWGTLSAERGAQSKPRGEVEPYTQQPTESPCSSRTPSAPRHPVRGIRIKTRCSDGAAEVQLTQGEPWA